MLAIGNWLAPSIIGLGGPRLAMVIGSITYLFFIVTFFFPKTWLLYFASAIIGLGASVIWTGQGNYLTLNCDSTTMSTNSGVFWAMLQCSMLFGNFFVYMVFQGKSEIDSSMRKLIFSVLTGICAVGVVVLALLRPALNKDGQTVAKRSVGPIKAFKEAVAMLAKKEMLLLCVTFFYTGLELSFYSGVYSPSIGFTLNINGAKELVGLSGIFIGIGEIAGGLLFGLLGKKTTRWGRDPVVILGLIVHLVSFFLIFLNLPDKSPLGDTNDEAMITSNGVIAILCSALLGFADACYNTQIYTAIGITFPDNSAPAFAIFKFTQSIAAACGFFYSSQIGLYAQLAILLVTSILGTATFCLVEFLIRRRKARTHQIGGEDAKFEP
ncbi:hypothetical protein AAG570_004615 [Ranatra chinensis]|uniref:UNC93-like protein MFSD11 n=1 Tax=Ranatra chinensis TaxID=642074 RepID=A0ABD0YJJ6_9HEMI